MIVVDGVLLLDKPTGITSNQALQRVKKLFKIRNKAGHTGSLDPLATGMLPICFGEATKFSSFLLNSDKKYQVIMQLGIKTTTADIDGEIIAKNDNLDQLNFSGSSIIQEILPEFIGEISQIPPVYSAIKINGVRSYKLARNADKLAKKSDQQFSPDIYQAVNTPPARIIKIYAIKLLHICNLKHQISLEVHCSKGTYIRALVEDLGQKLNCFATVIALRRIAVGDFEINSHKDYIFSIEQLNKIININSNNNYDLNNILNLKKLLFPIKDCLKALPQLIINQEQATMLVQGKQVYIENLYNLFAINMLVVLIIDNNKFLGIGEINNNNILTSKRLVNITTYNICDH
ncbi:MAG: tRNA pseudouridine(55) synthase TruB [Gammaproteobacteria bacterium]